MRGSFSSSNLPAIAALLLAGGLAIAATPSRMAAAPGPVVAGIGDLLSPGKLIAAHDSVAGGANDCEKCHDKTTSSVTSQRCLVCHADIGDRQKAKSGLHGSAPFRAKKCSDCHADHRGTDFDAVQDKNPRATVGGKQVSANAWGVALGNASAGPAQLDHKLTGYPLEGKHAQVGCEKCHTGVRPKTKRRVFTGVDRECLGCHENVHQLDGGSSKERCQECHGFGGWKVTKAVASVTPDPGRPQFDHTKTGFELKGKHASVQCTACHAGGVFKKVPHDTCSACHAKKDPHAKAFAAQDCATCHSENAWKQVTVSTANHARFSKYVPTGAHAKLGCARCHPGLKANPLNEACATCHKREPHPPRWVAAGGAKGCAACHTTATFADATVENAQHATWSKFALKGKHLALKCEHCHAGLARIPENAECGSCHRDAHKGTRGTQCATCHDETTWKTAEVAFDHAKKTRFALTGKHAAIRCERCHTQPGVFKHDTECASCHMPAHVKGLVSERCESCHTTSGFKLAKIELAAYAGPIRAAVAPMRAVSTGCESCHAGIEGFHPRGEIVSCVGCHGGNGTATTKEAAHVNPSRRARKLGIGLTSANARDVYGDLMRESPEYARFVNPGDLRVAEDACGGCHADIVIRVRSSIMATSANVPSAVLWANGAHPWQSAVYGEAFTKDGLPARLVAEPPPTEEQKRKGALPFLAPLPRWETTAVPDRLRIFERGNNTAGTRGRGTEGKIAGVYLNLLKTRLNDPALWLQGTNQQGGDFRQSGCTACHVPYANDGDPKHAGGFASAGNRGLSLTGDKTIPKDEPGHPIRHQMTRSVPVSQCLTCHHHQGNGGLTTYTGYIWHDQETDRAALEKNDALPGGKGQKTMKAGEQVAFAQYHGHDWNFRAVYWTDRRGTLLDANGKTIDFADPKKLEKAVHLADAHLEKGMHCIDCHGERDVHGDGQLYGAMIDAVETGCVDCHGTATARPTLRTTGAAAGTRSLSDDRTPFGQKQFERVNGRLIQRSKMQPDLSWTIPEVADIVDPASPRYSAAAARAMAIRKDGEWKGAPTDPASLAHSSESMECFSCHSSWNTNCYGCHLPFDANGRAKEKHRGLGESRGYADYYPQVLRSDEITLGINGTAQGNQWSPIRSASAVVVSVRDRDRNVLVNQQPTVSASGLSGQAVSPNVPHTVRSKQTRRCSDCHVSEKEDNNSILASTLGLGSNVANWMGDYAYVASDDALTAVRITEGYEPRPVIGSELHREVHPQSAKAHASRDRQLEEAHEAGATAAWSVAILGEYALVADGARGLVVYDTASVANKAAAQRLSETPVTRAGQWLRVDSTDARWVAVPISVPVAIDRQITPDRTQPFVPPLFHYAFIADRHEGLISVDIATLMDGDPQNNRLEAAARFNPGGALTGAEHVAFAGSYAYVSCGANGLAVVDVSDPVRPALVTSVKTPLDGPTRVAIQFRYAFVSQKGGVQVVDVTNPAKPSVVKGGFVALAEAHGLTPWRDHLLVAAGKKGLAIVDVTKAPAPKLLAYYDAEGALGDVQDVVVGATNASTFAYLAAGDAGLQVVSLVEPGRVPGHLGYAPRPVPRLIAARRTNGPARAVAGGLERDRYVDESGHAISVGNRVGSRPLNREEMQRLFLKNGAVWTVRDE